MSLSSPLQIFLNCWSLNSPKCLEPDPIPKLQSLVVIGTDDNYGSVTLQKILKVILKDIFISNFSKSDSTG